MRSRDLRTFTVEVKNKRRHPTTPPASLWADTEVALLKPAAVSNELGRGEPIEVRRAPPVGIAKAEQPRRVLPDLRPAKPGTDGVVGADPNLPAGKKAGAAAEADEATPGRPSRRGRSAVSQDVGPRAKRTARRIAPPVTVPLAIAEPAVPAIAVRGPAAAETSVAEIGIARDAPIIVPADAAKPARRWARRDEELPRSERWKRRLPGVCR